MTGYIRIPAASVPSWAIFTVPGRNQGQTVETAYSTGERTGNPDACEGDAYMRVTDETGTVTYYRRSAEL